MVNIDREAYEEARQDIAASRAAYARYIAFYPKADTVDSWELNRGAEGLLALREQRPRDAIALLEPVRTSAEKRGSARAQGRALLHLGDGFAQLAQPGQAHTLYRQALEIGTAANQRTLMLAALKRLADIEEAAGNLPEALRLVREYNALWNVIFDQDASLRITTREARAATDAALQSNREQQLVIERQRITLALAAVIFVLVSALLFLVVRFSNRERARVRALATANEELVKLNAELSTALADVKTLSGLIPICANCKRIRDDRGYWNQVEAYLEQNSEARFSHSICQTCGPELYGDYWTKANE
jgi:tetratricopeptide (TPR) repeat protein